MNQTEHTSRAVLAADTLCMKPVQGIPTWIMHVMDITFMEMYTGNEAGSYRRNPDKVYLDFQHAAGTCFIDQYLATNPLTMADSGYDDHTPRTATTGAEYIVLDDMLIDSPEAMIEHLERFEFPRLIAERTRIEEDADEVINTLLDEEHRLAQTIGPDILKVPYYPFFRFPTLRYGQYGYQNYLTGYVMYPDIIEEDFRLQGETANIYNTLCAQAILKGGLPRVLRLDHDMADSRGTLVDIRSLEAIWFPPFTHSIQPFLDADIRLLWHCDGNLSEMIPRLIEAGIGGFQGFQYEDSMDYDQICRMTDRNGDPLMIWAGVSVTRTLPYGSPSDVRDEMKYLVKAGPKVGLLLGASSSITPGVPWENLQTMIEGLQYFRQHGRSAID